MTEKELLFELQCYKMAFNPGCDIHNQSIKELAEFITLQAEIRTSDSTIEFKTAPVLEFFDDIIIDDMRENILRMNEIITT
ncbi:MAG: hypothetical protein OCD02_11270 [Spirochaetaceae bacterium]